VAPLDWGLGHTARCIPLIAAIIDNGYEPLVAGNGSQLAFLSSHFSNIPTLPLEGYDITYSAANRFAQAGLLVQVPGIMQSIKREQQWLQHTLRCYKVAGVISDNRYGLYSREVPTVILTHQPKVRTGMGRIADNMVQKVHYRFLRRFGQVWVPDVAGADNIGGGLSHCAMLPPHTKYIGLLSRFSPPAVTVSNGSILVLLSGPEPQRSILSDMLWQQVAGMHNKVVFVEGKEGARRVNVPGNVTHYDRVAGGQLQGLLADGAIVVCRSGYSSIMDLLAMGKRAILIPTPGQTEQEYLAQHLHGKGISFSARQDGFDLNEALRSSERFPFHIPDVHDAFDVHRPVLRQWLEQLPGSQMA
jgi:UDP-N-acetylglucosamine transferase subunit ALG13